MLPFCTITPSRGDRPELLEFCKHQLSRMTIKPDKSYFIDHKAHDDKPDLTMRVRMGVEAARADGFNTCYIIEDDDYYPPNFFENFWLDEDYDFVGSVKTLYYNIKNQTWREQYHRLRSSLFQTGFRISALDQFPWPDNETVFLDLHLWQWLTSRNGKEHFFNLKQQPQAIGIKHGMGKCLGIGHRIKMENQDQEWSWLKSHVDSEAYAFYRSL